MSDRRFTTGLLAAAAFLGVTTSSAQGTKIAAVNLQGALIQTEDGRSASATMKRYMDRRQAELDRRQRSLAREEKELRRQLKVLSRESFQRRYEHYQRRVLKVQSKFVEYNQQLQQKQANMMQPMTQKMFGVIRKAASRRGFDIVIDRAAAPYVRGDLDLTDLVVQMYNSGGGSAGGDDDKGGDGK